MKQFRKRMLSNGLAMALVVSSLATTTVQASGKVDVDFNDTKNHWAEKFINDFAKKGHIEGYGDGTFRPDNNVTRAEFIKIINMTFGYNAKGSESFVDVSENDWFYDEVLKAVKAGYIDGYEEDGVFKFKPDQNISREEACKIVAVVLKAKGYGDTKFKDDAEISDWAKQYVKGLVNMGIIDGFEDNTFRPQYNKTRAESVKTIHVAKANQNTGGGGSVTPPPVVNKIKLNNMTINEIGTVLYIETDNTSGTTIDKNDFEITVDGKSIKEFNVSKIDHKKYEIKLNEAITDNQLITVIGKNNLIGSKSITFKNKSIELSDIGIAINGNDVSVTGTAINYDKYKAKIELYRGNNLVKYQDNIDIDNKGNLSYTFTDIYSGNYTAKVTVGDKSKSSKEFSVGKHIIEISEEAVTKAEQTRDYNDYMEAQKLVNSLQDGVEKSELQERISNIAIVKTEELGEKNYITIQFPKPIKKFKLTSDNKSMVFGFDQDSFKLIIDGAEVSETDSNGFRIYKLEENEIVAKVDYSRVTFEVKDDNIKIDNVEFESKLEEFQIKFLVDNNVHENIQQVKEFNKVIKPSDPEKEGFTFIGWALNEDENNNIVDLDRYLVTRNAEFKAIFDEKSNEELATIAVEKAEQTRDYNDYSNAQKLVNKLPLGELKSKLQDRISNIVIVKVEKLGNKEYMTMQFPKQIKKFKVTGDNSSLEFGLDQENFSLKIKNSEVNDEYEDGFKIYTLGDNKIIAKVDYARVIFEIQNDNTYIKDISFDTELESMKVEFLVDGKSHGEAQLIKEFDSAKRPEDPEKEGFKFNGWALSSDESKEIIDIEKYMITEETRFEAIFEGKTQLDIAKEAVSKAENTKLKIDIDNARKEIDKLNEGEEKQKLESILNNIEGEIKAKLEIARKNARKAIDNMTIKNKTKKANIEKEVKNAISDITDNISWKKGHEFKLTRRQIFPFRKGRVEGILILDLNGYEVEVDINRTF